MQNGPSDGIIPDMKTTGIRFAVLAVMILTGAVTGWALEGGGRIAVLDFETGTGVSGELEGTLADRVRVEILKRDDLVLLDRRNIELIIEEQKLGASGLVSEETAVKIGSLAGASLVTRGTVVKFGSALVLSLTLIDVKTGEILAVVTREVRGGEAGLPDAATAAAAEVFGTGRAVTKGGRAVTMGGRILRSAVVPGWGQLAGGDRTKGIVLMAAGLTLDAAAAVSGYLLYRSYDAYRSTEEFGADYDTLWRNVEISKTALIVSASLAGALYAFNLVDAAFLGRRDVE